MRISDWSSDVCSSDLRREGVLDIFRCTQHREAIGCEGFGVAATRGRDLRLYAPKIDEPPAQTEHALGLRRIPAEQSVGLGGRGAKEAAEGEFGIILRHRDADPDRKSDRNGERVEVSVNPG